MSTKSMDRGRGGGGEGDSVSNMTAMPKEFMASDTMFIGDIHVQYYIYLIIRPGHGIMF